VRGILYLLLVLIIVGSGLWAYVERSNEAIATFIGACVAYLGLLLSNKPADDSSRGITQFNSTASSNESKSRREIYLQWLENDIRNRLQTSLHGAHLINVSSEPQANLTHPWTYQVYEPNNQQSAQFKDLFDAYAKFGKRLLLLGVPGSGKTTTLRNLALQLLEEAKFESAPVPVFVDISRWKKQPTSIEEIWFQTERGRLPLLDRVVTRNKKPPTFEDWLAVTLSRNPGSGVNQELAKLWVSTGNLVLLLDGFDELSEERQSEFVSALNQYLNVHPAMPVIVTTRLEEYKHFISDSKQKIALNAAVVLQPLSREQIDAYLVSANASALRDAVLVDAHLYELGQNPLLLSMMTLSYTGTTSIPVLPEMSPQTLRTYIFELFTEKMLQRKARKDKADSRLHTESSNPQEYVKPPYSLKQVNRYLGYYAVTSAEHTKNKFSPLEVLYLTPQAKPINELVGITLVLVCSIFVYMLSQLIYLDVVPTFDAVEVLTICLVATLIYFLLSTGKMMGCGRIITGYTMLFWIYLYLPYYVYTTVSSGVDLSRYRPLVKADVLLRIDYLVATIAILVISGALAILLFKGIQETVSVIADGKLNKPQTQEVTRNLLYRSLLFFLLVAIALLSTGFAIAATINLQGIMAIITICIVFISLSSTLHQHKFAGVGFVLLSLLGATIGARITGALGYLVCCIIAYPGSWFIGTRIQNSVKALVADRVNLALLSFHGVLPFRDIDFLNYASEMLLLVRTRGDYEFTHRLFRDHFAHVALSSSQIGEPLWRGKIHLEIQNYEEAITAFTQAISKNAKEWQAFAGRAEALRQIQRFQEAISDYTAIIESGFSTDRSKYLTRRAEIYLTLGKRSEALNDYNKAVEIEPNNNQLIARRDEVNALISVPNVNNVSSG
jgi:Cdc6-like AAA superfamily ATPase